MTTPTEETMVKASELLAKSCGAHPDCLHLTHPSGVAVNEAIRAICAALESAQPAPSDPKKFAGNQDWKGMDGAIAWHLIDRHADSWGDAGDMMASWLAANTPAPSVPDGYMHRYPDGAIRHSNGREINGSKPIESIPYFYGAAIPCGKQAAPTPPATEKL